MKSGMLPEDFAELREAIQTRGGKGAVRRGKLPSTGMKKTSGRKKDAEDLESYLDPALCMTGVTVQSKDRLFHRFAKLLSKKNKSISTDEVLHRLNVRERQAPTSVGGGVAIPHAFLSDLDRPMLGALSLKRAIQYDGADGEKVRTVFFLLGDENQPKRHISMLARIARLCSSPDFLDAFSKTKTNRELYKTIVQWDKRISSE
jgi:PTS system nitrogen regulatory IIA component